MIGNRVIPTKRLGQEIGDQLARDVVGGRAKSACGDYEAGAAKRRLHRIADRRTGVRYGDLTRKSVAIVSEPLTKPLLVGVEHAAKQQLGAGVDEFDLHCAAREYRGSAWSRQAWPSTWPLIDLAQVQAHSAAYETFSRFSGCSR